MAASFTRRNFVRLCMAAGAASLLEPRALPIEPLPLPPWSPGELDIHHIDTGRGNSTFLLCPDGSTMLIDCGASNDALDVSAPPRPNDSRRPGEWVARYALRQARAAGRTTFDFLIATHIHPDHIGDLPAGVAPTDGYVPTGLSQVDALMPAETVIDRGFPSYGELPPPDAPFAVNYLAWLASRQRSRRRVEALQIGSRHQIHLRAPAQFPGFSILNLAANGSVWTGNSTQSIVQASGSPPPHTISNENLYSIALRLSYGRFSYFTGGDLSFATNDGRAHWMDVESPVVRACGQVEVALADHHAYFDACGPAFTQSLNAQAYIVPAWHVTHPGSAQLERLLGAWPGEKPRDVFATEMLPANRLINARWLRQLRSTQGHVVVRVAPGGDSYRIFVVDSSVENGAITLSCGPYHCRG